ncbi:hypothetical protein ACFUZA_21760 [Streptomyces cellulosae]|uniref:hypothetical protein n=1 Tax=Streptomyces cellulosae TaxID=1968 RepID=UPI0036ADDB12
MSDAAVVALITSLSTLSGAGVTAWITLRTHQRQVSHQETLAAEDRAEARRALHRSARKDAYVQFINQAVKTAQSIAEMGRVEPSEFEDAEARALAALSEVWPSLALVNVEGPPEIADLADQVANALKTEGAKARIAHHASEMKPELIEASRIRWSAQREFTNAARRVLALGVDDLAHR